MAAAVRNWDPQPSVVEDKDPEAQQRYRRRRKTPGESARGEYQRADRQGTSEYMSWLPASEEAQATSKADEVEATSEQARRAEDEDTTSEALEV